MDLIWKLPQERGWMGVFVLVWNGIPNAPWGSLGNSNHCGIIFQGGSKLRTDFLFHFFQKRQMKPGSRCGWNFVPSHLRHKSATRLCMFSKVKAAERSPGNAPVCLNVYDLTPINGYVYWAGFGIFHAGIEVHGVEYAFGAHDYPTSGVFEVEPRQCPGFTFRKSIYMGMTCLDPLEAREFMERQSTYYTGDSYHLIVKNCNHFCDDICRKLTGRCIPKWVNRLARIGSVCNCILPDTLKVSKVQHGSGNLQICSEKRRLRSSLNCIADFEEAEKEVSISSMSLNSHYKGCLSSRDWEQARTIPELEE